VNILILLVQISQAAATVVKRRVKKMDMRVWPELIWLRTGTDGGLLRKQESTCL